MPEDVVFDTFPAFLRVWEQIRDQPAAVQMDRWLNDYLRSYPELADKLLASCADDGLDWRQVLAERTLPLLEARMPEIRRAHDDLLATVGPVCERARATLGLDFDVTFVLYIGVAWAGWGTTFAGAPACLLGLAGVVDCGWTGPDGLAGLTAHELGHVLHRRWREDVGVSPGRGPCWQLYSEGFAQQCEHLIMGAKTWHMALGEPGWLDWCRRRQAWLAAEYLRAVEAAQPVNRFFGNSLDIEGHSQSGYFLGHEVIAQCLHDTDLDAVAVLPPHDIERRITAALQHIAAQAT